MGSSIRVVPCCSSSPRSIYRGYDAARGDCNRRPRASAEHDFPELVANALDRQRIFADSPLGIDYSRRLAGAGAQPCSSRCRPVARGTREYASAPLSPCAAGRAHSASTSTSSMTRLPPWWRRDGTHRVGHSRPERGVPKFDGLLRPRPANVGDAGAARWRVPDHARVHARQRLAGGWGRFAA